jgi:hypothetical protein
MRFFALLTLSAILTGCCQTRVAERCGSIQSSSRTDCLQASPCGQQPCQASSNPCGKPSKYCDPPQGYRCRKSFKVEWKPVRYPTLKMVNAHEPCPPPKSRCISECRTGCVTQHGLSERTPFGDMPVLDSTPVLNPPPQPHEAPIPGVDGVPRANENVVPAPSAPEPTNEASAAHNQNNWNSQRGVPEVPDTPPVARSAQPGDEAYQDQRFAVEMWPYSPQYSGRR